MLASEVPVLAVRCRSILVESISVNDRYRKKRTFGQRDFLNKERGRTIVHLPTVGRKA
jgi:hypothetical protein